LISFQVNEYPPTSNNQNIIIDSKIINETGVLNDTAINLDMSFRIDQDIFNAKANIRNITEMQSLS
jgi:hypothetical protein